MTETISKQRNAFEIWHELDLLMELSSIIFDEAMFYPDFISKEKQKRFDTYQTRISSLTMEASERFNLIPDPEIGDPIPQIPESQKYFSQWYAETAEQALLIK